MPTEFSHDWTNKYIRVAWLTTSIGDEGHFYSPYKFQVNHDDINVSDENPIYLPVGQNHLIMKLHLVLIKSKLDQLHHVQPLIPFLERANNSRRTNIEKMSPKDLINKYQLDKSHLAFTLCTKRLNGSFEVHPETTTISSVMVELPVKPSSTSSKVTVETLMTSSVPNPTVRCPHCSHCFDSSKATVTTGVSKRKSTKGLSSKSTPTTINRGGKRKKNV